MTVISLSHIDKSFGPVRIVKDLNLTIADQEFLVFLGPSGCGKTTTMRMVAGLEQPTMGEVAFDGQRMNEVATQKRDVAMVFQNYGLYPHMSVAQNIAYPLKLRGMAQGERDKLVAKAADRVELGPFLKRMPRELSGGQRQRVAIARALVNNPSIILADEPTGNLDTKTSLEIMEIFGKIHSLGNTIILVTHEPDISLYAHRVVKLRDGFVESDALNPNYITSFSETAGAS